MKLVFVGAILTSLMYFFAPKYRHTYFYSRDKQQCITRLDCESYDFVPNHTYFVYGHYDDKAVPEDYCKPIRKIGKDEGWNGYIQFAGGHTCMLFRARDIQLKNIPDSLIIGGYLSDRPKLKKVADSLYDMVAHDRTGNSYFVKDN
ncbi:MAG TPA: hypothetical protein VMI35_06815 [Puia sp.]|nr:hypothetical protein [Puia sp.]